MPALPARVSLPVLCRAGGHTCAACCHGEAVPRPDLKHALDRHTRLFGSLIGQKRPGVLGLLWYEVRARGVAGLGWALLLLLPLVGEGLRWRVRKRVVCAYLGYEDEERTRVGCLIHPARQGGHDLRRWAFGLWRGLACGAADWLCPAARRYQIAPWQARRDFLRGASGCDWHDFGRAASRFGEPQAADSQGGGGKKPFSAS